MTQEQIINLIERSLVGQGSQIDSDEKLATIMKEINSLGSSYEYTKLSVGTSTVDEDTGTIQTPITTSQTTLNALFDDMDAGKNVFLGVLIDSVFEEEEVDDRQLIIYCNRIKQDSKWYLHTAISSSASGAWGGSELVLSKTANQSKILTYRA